MFEGMHPIIFVFNPLKTFLFSPFSLFSLFVSIFKPSIHSSSRLPLCVWSRRRVSVFLGVRRCAKRGSAGRSMVWGCGAKNELNECKLMFSTSICSFFLLFGRSSHYWLRVCGKSKLDTSLGHTGPWFDYSIGRMWCRDCSLSPGCSLTI